MGNTMLGVIVFLSLLSCAWNIEYQDMGEKVFVFQNEKMGTRVFLKAMKEGSLHSFTVCLKTFTDYPASYSIFSFTYTAMTIYKASSKSYVLTVGPESVTFYTHEVINRWVQLCISWESATGTVQALVDGQRLPRKGLSKGYVLKGKIDIDLGKRRTHIPYATEFVGEIRDFYMWDYALPISSTSSSIDWSRAVSEANILRWRNLTYELRGNVVVEPF